MDAAFANDAGYPTVAATHPSAALRGLQEDDSIGAVDDQASVSTDELIRELRSVGRPAAACL